MLQVSNEELKQQYNSIFDKMDEEEDSQVPAFGSQHIGTSIEDLADDFPGVIDKQNNFMVEVQNDLLDDLPDFEREEEEQKSEEFQQHVISTEPQVEEPKVEESEDKSKPADSVPAEGSNAAEKSSKDLYSMFDQQTQILDVPAKQLARSVYVPSKSANNDLLTLEEQPEYQDNQFWDLKHSQTLNYRLEDLLDDYN